MTSEEWKLLKEIRELKKQDEDDQRDYWHDKFENLSFEEDSNLRSKFKFLSENGFIQVQWADNIPYFLIITDKGISYSYFKDKIKSQTQ